MKVILTYFKDTGKYYSNGELDVPETWAMYQIFEHVRELHTTRRLPGLIPGSQFDTLVQAPDHPHAYPALIK